MKKIENVLLYTGFIITILASVAYLIVLYIIIAGFEAHISNANLLIFLGLGAITGVMISLSLRLQGIAFAKNTPPAMAVLEQYQRLIGNDVETKLMPLWLFHLINIIQDIFVKGLTIVLTLYFSISIIIEGLGDFKYFYLGIVNVILYIGLGILSMTKAYNHYVENEIPLLRQKINVIKRKDEKKNELSTKLERVSGENSERDGQSGSGESL